MFYMQYVYVGNPSMCYITHWHRNSLITYMALEFEQSFQPAACCDPLWWAQKITIVASLTEYESLGLTPSLFPFLWSLSSIRLLFWLVAFDSTVQQSEEAIVNMNHHKLVGTTSRVSGGEINALYTEKIIIT